MHWLIHNILFSNSVFLIYLLPKRMERNRYPSMEGNAEEEYKERSSNISSPSFMVGVDANGGGGGGAKYIHHTVTKFDTVAGIAIKYGVEVADIKRLNGLVTDLQMFALETLRIPLPGRHPPSPIEHETPQRPSSSDSLYSFESLRLRSSSEKSTSSLRSYYGLKSEDPRTSAEEGCKISVHRIFKDWPFAKSNPPLSQHRKSKSVAYGLTSENGDLIDRFFARQKSEADFNSRTPEKILREENCINTPISSITGKCLALRPKAATRTVVNNVVSTNMRKSSSTPSLQDCAFPSVWPTCLKPDYEALSALAIARPIFDGLPKPMTRKNKAALD